MNSVCLSAVCLCFNSCKYTGIAVELIYFIEVYYGLFGFENETNNIYRDPQNPLHYGLC